MTRVVLASANPDKAVEIAAILGDAVDLAPRPAEIPDVVEDGDTLEDNARLKAVAIVEATGEAALADDTGLEVDALDGAPGVHSARFAGEHAGYADNVAHLLQAMKGVSAGERTARFRTVAILRQPDGSEIVAEGAVEGVITEAEAGEGGFGYDPLFAPVEAGGRTFAEMTAEEKHAISHRGRAFRSLTAQLP
jgi:XTP/dITP diphosphohydrolase